MSRRPDEHWPKRRRRWKRKLGEAQNWRCCYCGGRLEPETATFEHVNPVILGGRFLLENLVLACRPCNEAGGKQIARALTPPPAAGEG